MWSREHHDDSTDPPWLLGPQEVTPHVLQDLCKPFQRNERLSMKSNFTAEEAEAVGRQFQFFFFQMGKSPMQIADAQHARSCLAFWRPTASPAMEKLGACGWPSPSWTTRVLPVHTMWSHRRRRGERSRDVSRCLEFVAGLGVFCCSHGCLLMKCWNYLSGYIYGSQSQLKKTRVDVILW